MNYLKAIFKLLILINILYLFFASILLNYQPEIFSAPNLPFFTNQDFEKANLTIESFGKESCPYCLILKDNFYSNLYHPNFNHSNITARYYNIHHPKVKAYFNEWIEKFNLPKNLKGAVPATIINGTYLILGYGEESTPFYLNILEQLASGNDIKEDPNQYLFMIKDEGQLQAKCSYYNLNPPLFPLHLSLLSVTLLLIIEYYYKNKNLTLTY